MKITVLLGAPGVGKGTVAARIAPLLNARHVSTGAMLRDAVKAKTPSGVAAQAYMERGELVPDPVLVDMIGELLASSAPDATILLDGFPRNVAQAEALDALAASHNAVVANALCLEVGESVILDRLGGRRVCPACGEGYHIRTLPPKKDGVCDKCGAALITRVDDQPDTIRNRLAVYAEKTAPLVSWYEKAGKLLRMDASADAETVAARACALLKS